MLKAYFHAISMSIPDHGLTAAHAEQALDQFILDLCEVRRFSCR